LQRRRNLIGGYPVHLSTTQVNLNHQDQSMKSFSVTRLRRPSQSPENYSCRHNTYINPKVMDFGILRACKKRMTSSKGIIVIDQKTKSIRRQSCIQSRAGRTKDQPKGTSKDLKTFVYLGAAWLRHRGCVFHPMARSRRPTGREGEPPQPSLQDNTTNNVRT